MLIRMILLGLIVFGTLYSFLWTATSTKYFNAPRIRAILKSGWLVIVSAIFTVMAIAVFAGADHLI